jgi:hypothetical protein
MLLKRRCAHQGTKMMAMHAHVAEKQCMRLKLLVYEAFSY